MAIIAKFISYDGDIAFSDRTLQIKQSDDDGSSLRISVSDITSMTVRRPSEDADGFIRISTADGQRYSLFFDPDQYQEAVRFKKRFDSLFSSDEPDDIPVPRPPSPSRRKSDGRGHALDSPAPPAKGKKARKKDSKLISCPDCGRQVSSSASSCPNCGAPLYRGKKKKKPGFIRITLSMLLLFFGIGLIVYSLSSNDPAHDGKAHITLDEYNQIQAGMTYGEVISIVGGDGEITSESEFSGIKTKIVDWYADAPRGANASVTFQDDVVISKSQFMLE